MAIVMPKKTVVMRYECWIYDSLQDAASRCFLQLLGLFDRPMNAAEKAV
jgi:hypothetical protein